MDAQAIDYSTRSQLSEIRSRLEEPSSIAKAAEACATAGNIPKAIEIALDVDQLLYEATTRLDGAPPPAPFGLRGPSALPAPRAVRTRRLKCQRKNLVESRSPLPNVDAKPLQSRNRNLPGKGLIPNRPGCWSCCSARKAQRSKSSCTKRDGSSIPCAASSRASFGRGSS
jgi:hypothetical protein